MANPYTASGADPAARREGAVGRQEPTCALRLPICPMPSVSAGVAAGRGGGAPLSVERWVGRHRPDPAANPIECGDRPHRYFPRGDWPPKSSGAGWHAFRMSLSQKTSESAVMRDERLDAVMEAIEAYLARHPEAADSAEGIARWWLSAGGLDASVDEVRVALLRLIERGVVDWRHLPDGRRIYGAAKRPSAGRSH